MSLRLSGSLIKVAGCASAGKSSSSLVQVLSAAVRIHVLKGHYRLHSGSSEGRTERTHMWTQDNVRTVRGRNGISQVRCHHHIHKDRTWKTREPGRIPWSNTDTLVFWWSSFSRTRAGGLGDDRRSRCWWSEWKSWPNLMLIRRDIIHATTFILWNTYKGF
jgi:hypothetical protein